MTTEPASAATEPRHLCGGAGGARGQRVLVPWRLVESAYYSDAALAVYMKVAALAARPEGCTAGVSRLAEFLGMSIPAVERALTQLINPCPDGITEVPTRRRTLPGGTGETALRRVRPIEAGELYVWLPVAAADALTPRLLRTYAILAYATARRLPTGDADIAWLLRHHTGGRAGLPIAERSVRRLTDRLQELGWIAMDRRAGLQGRHLYTVHRHPLQAIAADTDDGSGPDTGDGSLTIKEDRRTDRRENPQLTGDIRRRRDTGSRAVDTASNAPSAPYAGPPLTLSPRIWHVLQPVTHLLPGISPYLMRRIAREIGAQLDTYAAPERLRTRLEARMASVMAEDIRDPGRWLLGAALPRWGCGLDACETSVIWHSGHACHVCRDIVLHRRQTAQTQQPDEKPPDTGPPPQPRPALDPTGT